MELLRTCCLLLVSTSSGREFCSIFFCKSATGFAKQNGANERLSLLQKTILLWTNKPTKVDNGDTTLLTSKISSTTLNSFLQQKINQTPRNWFAIQKQQRFPCCWFLKVSVPVSSTDPAEVRSTDFDTKFGFSLFKVLKSKMEQRNATWKSRSCSNVLNVGINVVTKHTLVHECWQRPDCVPTSRSAIQTINLERAMHLSLAHRGNLMF